jgi:hypothetical protein
MDQVSRLVFDIVGRNTSGTKAVNDAALASERAHAGFSKLSGTLSGLGGPFDQVTMLAGNLGDALDGTLAKTQKLGLGLTAIGVGLIAFSAKDQQAQSQLQQTVQNTGSSYADYRKQIDEAISAQEQHAHTMDDTENALNTLTVATQDTSKSLSEMNLVADLAAAKHEKLAEAATQLVQAQAGNTRAFKSFGIVLDGNGTKTDQVNRALKELQDRLSGQASAAVNTFTGHLKVWGVELEDDLARLGKYGPAIAAAGAALTVISTVTQILVARRLADTAAAIRETAANTALAASYGAVAASATTAAIAQDASAGTVIGAGMVSRLPGYAGLATRAAVPLALAYGAYTTYQQTQAEAHVNPQTGLAPEDAKVLQRVERSGTGAAQGYIDRGGSGLFLSGDKARKQVVADLQQFVSASKNAGTATDKAKQASDAYATALTHEKDAVTKAMLSLDGQIKALQATTSGTFGLSTAEDALQGAMHNLAQSVHDGTHALDGHTAAAENNRAALRDAAQKMLDLTSAQQAAHVSGEKIRATAVAMSQALEINATKILGNKHAVDEFLRSLGVLPPQIAKALGATGLLAEQTGEQVMHDFASGLYNGVPLAQQAAKQAAAVTFKHLNLDNLLPGGSGPQPYSTQVGGTQKKAQKSAADLVNTWMNAWTPAVSTAAGSASNTAAKQAQQKMTQLATSTFQAAQQAYKQVQSQVESGFNITSLPQKTDLFGTAYGPGRIDKAANAYVKQLEKYAHLVGQLRKKGLNETAIEQLTAGGVGAIPAMEQILRDHEIGALNKDFRIISHVSGQIASAQVSATQDRHLEDVLARLPDRMAAALEKKLRNMHIEVAVKEISKHQAKHVRAR